MKNDLQAIATVLSLVNPAICAAMFLRIEAGRTASERLADATKVVVIMAVILAAAALVGTRILDVFGVSLDAFTAAGGAVLSWIGFSMLSTKPTDTAAKPDVSQATQPSLGPLILFAASPGTITGVISLSAAHTKLALPATVLVAIGVTALVTWIVLVVLSRRATGSQGDNLVRDMVSRYMGLIVFAMGVQFMLSGAHDFLRGS